MLYFLCIARTVITKICYYRFYELKYAVENKPCLKCIHEYLINLWF